MTQFFFTALLILIKILISDVLQRLLPLSLQVESVMERVILFLLNQIVFGMLERSLGEHIYFSTHPVSEYGKIFWKDGEAVGFYTVKKKGVNVLYIYCKHHANFLYHFTKI